METDGTARRPVRCPFLGMTWNEHDFPESLILASCGHSLNTSQKTIAVTGVGDMYSTSTQRGEFQLVLGRTGAGLMIF